MIKRSLSAWRRELKQLWQNRFLRLALVVVSLVPLLYGALYLYAFWNPYGRINELPVAVVNEDAAFKQGEEQYHYGQDLVDNLKKSGTLKWTYVDRPTAETGLKNKDYYAAVYIPGNFSERILSVNTTTPEQAGITYRARQASSYIASQITSRVMDELVSKLNVEIEHGYYSSIFSSTHQSAKDLVTAGEGATTLADGLSAVESGDEQLSGGAAAARAGASTLSTGLTSLKTGALDALSGSQTLLSGSQTVSSGLTSLTANLQSAQKGLNDLQTGLNGGQQAASGTVSYLNSYQTSHPEVAADTTFQSALAAARQTQSILAQATAANQQLSSGAAALVGGSQQLTTGSTDLTHGLTGLTAGLSDLSTGLKTAHSGANDLTSGLSDLVDGTDQLQTALSQARSGASTLSAQLSTGAQISLSATDPDVIAKKLDVLAEPVTLNDQPVDVVPNYGTGFTPYFAPIALWVGALLMFFVVNIEQVRDEHDQISWGRVAGKTMVLLSLGIAQAIILGLVLQFGLGLAPLHPWLFYLFLTLISWSFTCIMQFLVGFASDAGRFVGIILLVLQLISAAGTFPIETAPAAVRWIHSWLPMTYAVNALREIISGGQISVISQSALILAATALVFALLYVVLLPYRLRTLSLNSNE